MTEPSSPDETTIEQDAPETIVMRGDVVLYRGIPIGQQEDAVLVLDLGWLRLAGLGVRVLDDPKGPRHRGGVTLEVLAR